jgi:acyl-CoA thioester hydrolase/1,4-dihydroxy-2-naphthoyl-CoA hydrolase
MTEATTPKVFETQVQIHFREADPAGIMFFGNILGLSHDVFEEFLAAHEISWDEWFKPKQWATPIRHCEVDFLFPFIPGQKHTVKVDVKSMTQSSFQMRYQYLNSANKVCARVLIVHTFVDQQSFQKVDIPDHYRQLFSTYLNVEK